LLRRADNGFPGRAALAPTARGRERWVINKIRALNAWYSKGIEHGSRLRTAVNQCESVPALRALVEQFFLEGAYALAGSGLDSSMRSKPTNLE